VANLNRQALNNLPVFDQDYIGTISRFLDAGAVGTGGATLIVDWIYAGRAISSSPKPKKEKGPATTVVLDAFNVLNYVNYAGFVGNLSQYDEEAPLQFRRIDGGYMLDGMSANTVGRTRR
jgi:hypothetical protein